jgi:hypothetical protein
MWVGALLAKMAVFGGDGGSAIQPTHCYRDMQLASVRYRTNGVIRARASNCRW